jgi:hypothetical protein
MLPNRKKAWVEALLGKREAIEQAIGMPLGRMLGCGHWGCVFESDSPWVVKLSIDPTEGPIWSKIAGLVRDDSWGDRGFTEIKSITRLTPDLRVGGKTRKVWAIVRENVEPVFREYSLKELGEKGRGTFMRTSPFTNELLGIPAPTAFLDRYAKSGTPAQKDFVLGLAGLYKYRELATLWHLLGEKRLGSVMKSRLESILRTYPLRDYSRHPTREEVEERIQGLDRYFHGPHMGPIGESLAMLATHGIYLRDVHNMNIGWHIGRGDNDWTYVVIFDPGHTPTEEADIETALIANGRQAL